MTQIVLPSEPLGKLSRRTLGLTELAQATNTAATARAALSLWGWATGGPHSLQGPGILTDRDLVDTHPGSANHAVFRVYAPLAGQRRTLVALLYLDGSALVGIDDHGAATGRATFLPAIFRVRNTHRFGHAILKVRNPDRHPSHARISFQERRDDSGVPAWDQDAVDGDDALHDHPTLEALRADMRRLLPLFDDLPWIVPPVDGVLPAPVLTPTDCLTWGLPAEACGARPAWPAWLPHLMISAAERRAIEDYAQEIADWVLASDPAIRRVEAAFRAAPPSCRATRVATGLALRVASETGTFDLSSHYDLLANPTAAPFPVAAEKVRALDFGDLDKVRHKVRTRRPIAMARAETVSRHRAIDLLRRFGVPKRIPT